MHGIAFIVAALTVWSPAARAVTVSVVRPPHPSPVAAETLFRVSGELRSLGIEIRMVDLSDTEAAEIDGGAPVRLDRLATAQSTDAAIALLGSPAPTAIALWAADRRGHSVNRRLPLDPTAQQAPRTIAIRAIELLRSSLLELELATTQAPGGESKVAPPPAQAALVEGERSRTERFALGAGGATVRGFDGVGLFVRPLLRFDWLFRPWWLLQGEASGLGTRATVQGLAGSARVGQDQAVAGIGYRPLAGRLSPIFVLSAGALHTVVEGHAVAQFESQRATRWSLLLDGAAGACLRLSSRLKLTASAHLQLAVPYPAVRFVGETVATAARPNVLVALAAEVWL